MIEGLLLQERPRASAWAEEHLVFPRGTSPNAPGRLSFARTPYVREIVDNVLNSEVEEMYLCWASQAGKSASLLAAFGVMMELQPNNGIWAMKSDDQMRAFSRKRIMPMIDANPLLARHVRSVAGKLAPLSYEFDNMDVKLTGVGSPAQLASESTAWIIADEAAKYEWLKKEEAPPLELLRERTKGFPRRLHIFASTPTTVENEFWQGFLSGEIRQWYMPCPYCRQEFTFEFKNGLIVWDKPDGRENSFSDIDLAERTARYRCPHCGGEIWQEMKQELVASGSWKVSDQLRLEYGSDRVEPSRKVKSYQLNSLASPFLSFGQVVRAFLEAQQKTTAATALQNFHNSWLALPYEFTKVTIKKKHISALCGTHRRKQLPEKYHIITVGYDPGGDATHWVAMALLEGGDIWVIDWGTILAFRSQTHLENRGTDDNPRWETVVDKPGIAPHFAGLQWGLHGAQVGFVDAGYSTGDIYEECLMLRGRLQPTKGSPSKVGDFWVRPAGGKWHGLNVVTYVDYQLKMSLYSETITRGRRPRLILPCADDCDEELLAGLSGQKLVQKNGNLEWKKVANDHYGDCIKLGGRLAWWMLKGEFEEGDDLQEEPEE